jgi:superfamily I DNA/RNA helicase
LPLYFQAKNKHSKILDEEKAKDVEEINTRKENKIIETYKQISPLLNLIQSKTITDIIERTYEQIKFDDYLSNNKQELLKKDGSFTKNESVINCVSLSLFKNPTAIFKKVSMSIYMHV